MVEPREPYEIPKGNPCNGCNRPERRVGCHAECFDYMLFFALKELERDEQKKEREVDKYIGKKKAERTAIRRRTQEART